MGATFYIGDICVSVSAVKLAMEERPPKGERACSRKQEGGRVGPYLDTQSHGPAAKRATGRTRKLYMITYKRARDGNASDMALPVKAPTCL